MRRILASTLLTTFAACNSVSAPAINTARSDKPQIVRSATPEQLAEVGKGNRAFAFSLYSQIAEEGKNLFYSPYSISSALSMLYPGARGTTKDGIAQALQFPTSDDEVNAVANVLAHNFADESTKAGEKSEPFTLNVANAIWGQEDFKFLPAYLDVLAENYGAGLQLLNFVKQADSSRLTINSWVADQTQQKIKDLLQPGTITSDTRLVLTNAIYFKADWQSTFNKNETQSGDFHRLDGTATQVPLMHNSELTASYTKGSNFQSVELPYVGGKVSMLVVLPDAGKLSAVEQALPDAIAQTASTRSVNLTLPKFGFEWDASLKPALTALGMKDAFGNADLSGIDGGHDLAVSDVVHKAFVAVDENGTEAAAATAVIIGETAAHLDVVNFTVDRPFIFLIRDLPTNTILFVGRVVDPSHS